MDTIKSDSSTTASTSNTKNTKTTTTSKKKLTPAEENMLNWKKKDLSIYSKTYTSYSGHDMVCVFEIPLSDGKTISQVVGSLQTISYSIHNEKMPVRVLGDMNMKSMVFGSRTIAGSIIFTVFDKHWVEDLLDKYYSAIKHKAHALTDELPNINISIAMMNEYGDKSRLALYGVTFVNEGQTMSINDMYTENTFQFYAKDIDYLTTDTDYNTSKSIKTKETIASKTNEINSSDTGTETKIDKSSSSSSSSSTDSTKDSAVGSDEPDNEEKVKKDANKLADTLFTAAGLTQAVNALASRIAALGLPNSAAQPLILALRNAEKKAKKKIVESSTANKNTTDKNATDTDTADKDTTDKK